MATSVPSLLRDLRLLAVGDGLPDAELLARFVRRRDESAFTALVARHGPMVWHACQRVLGDAHAAEDAFQATFLLLSRKAGQLARPDALTGWLHGVAVKTALNARARRRPVSLPDTTSVAGRADADPLAQISARELLTLLDEEIQRLPEACRVPVVLCCLEGQTQEEAARRLGWTPGSVKGRLERGRRRLHARLARRGLSLSAALAAAEVARGAALSTGLLRATADVLQGGNAAAEALAEAVGKGMLAGKAHAAFMVVVALTLTLGGGALAYRTLDTTPVAEEKPEVAARKKEQPAVRVDALGDPLPPGAIARLGTVRLRHGRRVSGLALAPDGKTLATSSDGHFDVDLHLWDVATGKKLRRIGSPSPLNYFSSLAISADGRTLAAGESGPWIRRQGEVQKVLVRLWDLPTGKQLEPCSSHADSIYSVTISPDGKTVASCGLDKTVRLWDARTSRELHRCEGHQYPIYCVAFSPDGKTLASSGYDKMILWDVATGKQKQVIEGPPKGAMKVAFSPDGKSIVAGSNADPLLLIEVASGKIVREFKGHQGGIWAGAAFLPGGKALISAGRDGTVRTWDIDTGKELRQLRAGRDDLLRMSLSADGKLVAAGGQSGTVHLWSTATGKALHAFAGHTGSIQSLRYSPNGKTLASGGGDGTLHLWDVRTGKDRKLTENQAVSIGYAVFSPDGKTLVADDDPGNGFSLYDVATASLVRRFDGHQAGTSALDFSPDGKTIASGGHDKLIRLWEAATGKHLRSLAGHPEAVGAVTFSPDGKFLASLGNYKDRERILLLWDVATGRILHRCGRAHGSIAFSPDGLQVMAVGDSETVRFWDTATGKESRVLKVPKRRNDHDHVFSLGCPTFSPDGKYLALGWFGQVRIFELASGQEVYTSERVQETVRSIAFAPDGRTVACDDSASVLIWDITGRAPDGRLRDQHLDAKALESTWNDLYSEDAPRAHRAVWSLIAGARQSIPYLRERLTSRPPVEDKQVQQWITDLDSDQFATREKATAELKKLDRFAESALRQALAKNPSLEPRRRIEQLLKQLATPGRTLHAARVTEVLEQAGTPEARQVLEVLAREPAEGLLSRQARASLKRMTQR